MSSTGSICWSTLCVLGLLNFRHWASLHVFLCYPYIFFAKVLVPNLTHFFFVVGWFDFFSFRLYFGHKSKGYSFRYKFIYFPGMWNQKNKIKLWQEKSVSILKEVLFDCEMNVGTGATEGGCKTFPGSV